jgi:ADP-ribose pyrophosphatase YjhB (NUDIX family)
MRKVEETSAGGLVLDYSQEQARVALIGRHDRRGRLIWSLPKGHIEPGETAEEAALREVAEETGITARIVGVLGTINYWFIADGRRIHKTVHHYLMRALSGELSTADMEVDEVAWVPLDELPRRLRYRGERALASRVPGLLGGPA